MLCFFLDIPPIFYFQSSLFITLKLNVQVFFLFVQTIECSCGEFGDGQKGDLSTKWLLMCSSWKTGINGSCCQQRAELLSGIMFLVGPESGAPLGGGVHTKRVRSFTGLNLKFDLKELCALWEVCGRHNPSDHRKHG